MSVSLTNNFLKNARGLTFKDANGIAWTLNPSTNALTAAYSGAGSGSANPSAKVGLTAVDGSAPTFMTSDSAPPIDQGIAPTWTAKHIFSTPPAINGITWTAPTLLNSWVNFGSPFTPAGYYKDPTGRVHLRGLVKSGSSASAIIFTLPAGFIPANTHVFAAVSNEAICDLRVDTSGNVFANAGGSTTWVSLDGISFTTF